MGDYGALFHKSVVFKSFIGVVDINGNLYVTSLIGMN